MENHLPEEPELTGRTLRDPFWQALSEAHHAKIDACGRAVIAQTEQDKAWHQKTKDHLMQVLMAQPHHEIPNVTVTTEFLRALGS